MTKPRRRRYPKSIKFSPPIITAKYEVFDVADLKFASWRVGKPGRVRIKNVNLDDWSEADSKS